MPKSWLHRLHDNAEVSLTPDSRALLTIAFEHRHELSPYQPTLQSLIQLMTDAEKYLFHEYPFRWFRDDSSDRSLPKLGTKRKRKVGKEDESPKDYLTSHTSVLRKRNGKGGLE